MNSQLIIESLHRDILGNNSPDPLQFAFKQKKSAHAGGSNIMVPADSAVKQFERALQSTTASDQHRCLYVHIPFCRVRCTYCNFFQHASSKGMMADYFSALLTELQWKAQQSWTQASPFHAVYIGGGTPTDLSAEQIRVLGSTIRSLFPLTSDCELTLEGRINRFDDKMFDYALKGGFNRFSFGVQSFNTQVRRAAKRLDDRKPVIKRLQQLVSTNSAPIVIDLLYGLPYQTMDIWKQDLDDFLDTGVHGVDLYQLIELSGMPMEGLVNNGKLPQPATTAEKGLMFEYGVEFMSKHHINRLSVNHWACNNRERSIYNSLAKTTAEVLPVGCGAGGNIGGFSIMQHRTLESYINAITQQQHSVAMLFKQSPSAHIHSAIKAAFDHGVLSKSSLIKHVNFDLFTHCLPLFKQWQQHGLVLIKGDYLTLTVAGQFWSVTLAQNLITAIDLHHHNMETSCYPNN